MGTDGGSSPTVVEKDGSWRHWSPDGSLLVFMDRGASSHIHILDLRTGTSSLVPGSAGMLNPQWVGDDRLVAGTQDFTKLMVFDVRTQQWSELVSFTAPGYVVNWIHSPDHKSVDYITGGTDPMLLNVRLADRRVETITSLKGLHRATGPAGNTEISVAPDGSPVFTRDIGTQEIYALSIGGLEQLPNSMSEAMPITDRISTEKPGMGPGIQSVVRSATPACIRNCNCVPSRAHGAAPALIDQVGEKCKLFGDAAGKIAPGTMSDRT